MIIDTSAVIAVIGREPGHERIIRQLAVSPRTQIAAPTRLEAGIALTASHRALTAGPVVAARVDSVVSCPV